VRLKLTRVAKVSNATALAVHPTDDALYVATKAGRIVALGPGERSVLDLSADVTDFRDKPRFNEQGLLGIAFSPDGRQLYADFTDRDGDTTIRRYAFREGRADPSTAVDVLRIDQPGEYHLGGQTVFGPDGLLYIGVGDGGVRNGTTAQRLGTLLGKILRIAPTPTQRRPYRIPTDNPFVKISGARAEIFSYGLRNPWRFSFDRATGDLWIADVGENRWEEINFRPATRSGGENFGWAIYEGPDAEVSDRSPANLNTAGRHVFPVYAYPHPRPGCAAVVGGYVYRGSRIPRLAGAYVFGDLCDGRLRALRARAGRVIDQQMFDVHVPGITSFGEDHNGELYVLSLNAGVFRIDPA
jgi:glucose/arabinose dehydrogenase